MKTRTINIAIQGISLFSTRKSVPPSQTAAFTADGRSNPENERNRKVAPSMVQEGGIQRRNFHRLRRLRNRPRGVFILASTKRANGPSCGSAMASFKLFWNL